MKKLTTKASGFSSGKKIFLNNSGNYSIMEDMTLPEGYVLGADVPSEDGTYFLETPLGAFVFKVSGGSTIWSTWSGSVPDGQFFYNNTDVIPSNSPVAGMVYDSEGTANRLNQNATGLVDFGEFFISTYRFPNTKIIKLSKDFSEVTILEFPELSGANVFDDPVVSKDLGGVLFLVDTLEGQIQSGVLYLIDVYSETLSEIPLEVVLPQNYTDLPRNRIYGLLEYPVGKIAVLREREALIYQYSDGSLNYLYSKFWSSPEVDNASLLYPVYPLLSTIWSKDTLYLTEQYRFRAINTITDEMKWEIAEEGVTTFYDFGGAVSRVTGNLFITRWIAFEPNIFEYDKDTGEVVNSWNVASEFSYWGDAVPIYVEDSGKIHIKDGDRITVFDPEENIFTVVISEVDTTTSGNFAYWGKSFKTKNGYIFTPIEGGQEFHWYNIETYEGGVISAPNLGAWDNFLVFSEGAVYYNARNSIERITFN